MRQLKARGGGGPELLAYQDGRRWRDVTSTDVNDYLKTLVGEEFSAKDLRTWHATVLAAVIFAREHDPDASPTAQRRTERAVMTAVSDTLGNTPTVARSSYVDPRVIERYEHGEDLPAAVMRAARLTASPQPPRVERAVVTMLS